MLEWLSQGFCHVTAPVEKAAGMVGIWSPLLGTLQRLKATAWEVLFPSRCVGCGRLGVLLCDRCVASFVPREPPWCLRCGESLQIAGDLCLRCREASPSLEGIRSLYRFQGPLQKAIHTFKYRRLKALAVPLGQLLAEDLVSDPLPVDLIVPVPLHPETQRQRGYNQSTLLAREVHKRIGIPMAEEGLRRVRKTLPQVRTTSAAERRANVVGAFAGEASALRGKSLLLIDDVCTTGATLTACAVAAKDAGAVAVWGLTLAREA